MKKSDRLRIQRGLDGKLVPGAYLIARLSGNELKMAGRILDMIPDEGFYQYDTIGELEKRIILRYWQHYEDMPTDGFESWFLHKATPPERISRAFKELYSSKHHAPYLIIKPEVLARAKKSRENYERRLGYVGASDIG